MNLLTHAQLLATSKDQKPRWLVEGLVRAGSIGFIAGEPKVTKSWLALHMAQSVATGVPFLGKFLSTPSNVLYIQEEDAIETVMTRYRLLEKGHVIPTPADGRLTYAIQTGYRINFDILGEKLTEAVRAAKAELVILDVLNKLHNYDDSNQKQATTIMNVFEHVRRETGAAIVIVHHFSKGSPNKRGNQRMRGSSVLAGWSENSLYLSRSGALTFAEVESKFAETPGFAYKFEAVNEGLKLTLEASQAAPQTTSSYARRWNEFYMRERRKKAWKTGRGSFKS